MNTTTARNAATCRDDASTQIPAGITLVSTQLRSTNLERDTTGTLRAPYIGARARDMIARVAVAVADPAMPRAWSFTGPYGSGKSTLANVIDALLGHDRDRRAEADTLVRAADPDLAAQLQHARHNRVGQHGMLGGIVTARREPLAVTVARALRTAANRRWASIPKSVNPALRACERDEAPGASQILAAVEALCSYQPLLLVIDEFGKTLEHLADNADTADGDVFLLQELAEHGAGTAGLPLFLLTLQHQSLLDYAARSPRLQTREWAKVQGRFEDVTFTVSIGESLGLLTHQIDASGVTHAGAELIAAQAEAGARAWTTHGLGSVVGLDAATCRALYPLHPLTAVAAPLLATQIGQYDRSLSGFLAGDEPHTLRRALDADSTRAPRRANTVRLAQLYDYFLSAGRTTLAAASNAGRWIEINGRLSEAHGLSETDRDILKTIGILNLLDTDGALRATAPMLQFALHDPVDATDSNAFTALTQHLDSLVKCGFLVHRAYSGEYRIWQGSDLDIDARLAAEAEKLDEQTVVTALARRLPVAVVAGRHSQHTGMLRHFVTALSTSGDKLCGPSVGDAADGLLIYHVGGLDDSPVVESPLPVLVGRSPDAAVVVRVGTELVALEQLLADPSLDVVARAEIAERAAQTRAEVLHRFADAYAPTNPDTRWHLWPAGIGADSSPERQLHARSLAGLVSAACDAVYVHTPHVRNEMLGRHQLTSQGAKARRELLALMLTHASHPTLGIAGFGPERAIYDGVLAYLGLHRHDEATAMAELTRPGQGDHAHSAAMWTALESALDTAQDRTEVSDLFSLLQAPPYGVKAGVAPVPILAALLLRRDDVAIFEDGTFTPRLTPDIVERLVKAPHRFSIKVTTVRGGQRGEVLARLTTTLHATPSAAATMRNAALLAVTRTLIGRVATLSMYARRTSRLSPETAAVRTALLSARDPDELIFTTLPRALRLTPIRVGSCKNPTIAATFTDRLITALDELAGVTAALRAEVLNTIARTFRLPNELSELRSTWAQRLQGFADAALEARLRGLVSLVLNEQLPDEDWLNPVIVRFSGAALEDWTDAQADAFSDQVREIARSLDRVSHLHREPSVGDSNAQTRLLTLTAADGAEHRMLLHVPDEIRGNADELANTVAARAEHLLGRDGVRILLASLARQLTDDQREPLTSGMETA